MWGCGLGLFVFWVFLMEKLLSKCCTSCASVLVSDSGPAILLVDSLTCK